MATFKLKVANTQLFIEAGRIRVLSFSEGPCLLSEDGDLISFRRVHSTRLIIVDHLISCFILSNDDLSRFLFLLLNGVFLLFKSTGRDVEIWYFRGLLRRIGIKCLELSDRLVLLEAIIEAVGRCDLLLMTAAVSQSIAGFRAF